MSDPHPVQRGVLSMVALSIVLVVRIFGEQWWLTRRNPRRAVDVENKEKGEMVKKRKKSLSLAGLKMGRSRLHYPPKSLPASNSRRRRRMTDLEFWNSKSHDYFQTCWMSVLLQRWKGDQRLQIDAGRKMGLNQSTCSIC